MAAQGGTSSCRRQRVEGYRNFATKLWNAARFAEMNGCERVAGFDPAAREAAAQSLGAGRARRGRADGRRRRIEAYRFNDAANAAYRFVWNVFCDWYLELAKPMLHGRGRGREGGDARQRRIVLDGIAKLLHPFMPYITEELWAIKGEDGACAPETQLALAASWPCCRTWPRRKPKPRSAGSSTWSTKSGQLARKPMFPAERRSRLSW